jgi:hypothetical protein
MLRDDFYASKLSLIRDIAPSRRRFSEVRKARNFRARVTFFAPARDECVSMMNISAR